jgi:uncharacterized protein (TIGR00369 family)
MTALTLDEAATILRDSFAPWVLELGLSVTALDPRGTATLAMPAGERVARLGGTICGQALMALADTAMVFAIAAASGGFRPMTTVGQTTSFLRPIAGRPAVATARLLKLGRTLAFGEVAIAAEGSADPAVQVSSTYALLGPAPA